MNWERALAVVQVVLTGVGAHFVARPGTSPTAAGHAADAVSALFFWAGLVLLNLGFAVFWFVRYRRERTVRARLVAFGVSFLLMATPALLLWRF